MTQPAAHDSIFHPAVDTWFRKTFPGPTAAQARAWPAIQAGRHVLVAAPTGSGKTLAAFLAAIDALVRRGGAGALPDETFVVYVSPPTALSHDTHRNPAGAHWLVRHPETHRGNRALSGGNTDAGWRLHDRRHRTRTRARSRPRGSTRAARSGHVGGRLAAGLRTARRAHPRAPHDTG